MIHVVEASAAGVGRHVVDLLSGLAGRGLSTALIYSTLRMDRRFAEGLESLRARGVRAQALDMPSGISVWADANALRQMVRHIRTLGPVDIVHSHSGKAGILGRLAGKLLGLPVVHTPNGVAWRAARGPVGRLLFQIGERALGRLTDRLVAVSKEEATSVLAEGLVAPARLAVIENGVPIPGPLQSMGLRTEDWVGSGPIVGAVGRLEPQKDPVLFVDTAAAVLERGGAQCKFVWVGDGSLHREVEKAIKRRSLEGRVLLLGHRDDVETLYAAFSLLVVTSRYEGLSYALLEAMRAGVPIVTVPVEGARSVVGGAGIVVADRQPLSLAQAVLSMLRSRDQRNTYGELARERVMAHYGLERMVARTAALYDVVLQRTT